LTLPITPVDQHVAIPLGVATSPSLEQVLIHDAHLALRPADRLPQHPREDGIGLLAADGMGEFFAMVEHGSSVVVA